MPRCSTAPVSSLRSSAGGRAPGKGACRSIWHISSISAAVWSGSWTHLERQRGGGGFMGGPGETQIEADRRLLQDRITKLKRELEAGQPHPRPAPLQAAKGAASDRGGGALVGYTNAGKVDALQQADGADVMAKNMLFATLDPTLRRVKLPTAPKSCSRIRSASSPTCRRTSLRLSAPRWKR